MLRSYGWEWNKESEIHIAAYCIFLWFTWFWSFNIEASIIHFSFISKEICSSAVWFLPVFQIHRRWKSAFVSLEVASGDKMIRCDLIWYIDTNHFCASEGQDARTHARTTFRRQLWVALTLPYLFFVYE